MRTLYLGLLARGYDVSPVQKVITTPEGLQTQSVAEGKQEAVTYDKLAFFCKDRSVEKTWGIEVAQDRIKF